MSGDNDNYMRRPTWSAFRHAFYGWWPGFWIVHLQAPMLRAGRIADGIVCRAVVDDFGDLVIVGEA
jgi:hypothetical protein